MKRKRKTGPQLVENVLKKHFTGYELHDLVSASRTFPNSAKVDLQTALEKLLPEGPAIRQSGDHSADAIRRNRHRRSFACALPAPRDVDFPGRRHTIRSAAEPGRTFWQVDRFAHRDCRSARRKRRGPLSTPVEGNRVVGQGDSVVQRKSHFI